MINLSPYSDPPCHDCGRPCCGGDQAVSRNYTPPDTLGERYAPQGIARPQVKATPPRGRWVQVRTPQGWQWLFVK